MSQIVSPCLFPSPVLTRNQTSHPSHSTKRSNQSEREMGYPFTHLFISRRNKHARRTTEKVDESNRDHSRTISRYDRLACLEKSGHDGSMVSTPLPVTAGSRACQSSAVRAQMAIRTYTVTWCEKKASAPAPLMEKASTVLKISNRMEHIRPSNSCTSPCLLPPLIPVIAMLCTNSEQHHEQHQPSHLSCLLFSQNVHSLLSLFFIGILPLISELHQNYAFFNHTTIIIKRSPPVFVGSVSDTLYGTEFSRQLLSLSGFVIFYISDPVFVIP
ncbi:hypothetical protein C348_02697 [Cryptococcus neoformans Gb118]|nr:hypothetical protein C348_02697 [Cryptococcus neoformans var. grubii Gb118]